MDVQMKKLLDQVFDLVRLGKEVERLRLKLKRLVDLHVPYDSMIMMDTFELFQ